MSGSKPIRIAIYNPFVSDSEWIVGSFRAEEMCHALSEAGVEGVVATPYASAERKISDEFTVTPLPRDPLKGLRTFVRIVQKGDFSLVQERLNNRGLMRAGFGVAASSLAGLPFVLELHNVGPPLSSIKRLPCEVLAMWMSDMVFSYVDVDCCPRYGARKEKFVPVPNGYSERLLNTVSRSGENSHTFEEIAEGRHVFGYFGGLTRSKGVDVLLDVADRLSSEKGILFVFGGRGEMESRIRATAGKRDANVAFLGILDRRSTMEWMSRCRATFAIHDELQSAIGNPVKVVESLALGVPVIVNSGYVISEKLKMLCAIVDSRDPVEIAQKVLEIAADNTEFIVPDFMPDFSIEAIAKNVIRPAYERLIDGSW